MLSSSVAAQADPPLLVRNWNDLSQDERTRALENYQRFRRLPPAEQQSLEDKYKKWQNLPSGEQDRIRRNYEQYLKMPQNQKDNFERLYKQWQSEAR